MDASTAPQTLEKAAALRAVAVTHRRRHRWVALVPSVYVSVHTTIILHTIWHDWPLDARDLGPLAFFVGTTLGGLGWMEWGLRRLRASEAMDRQWTVQDVCWRAQSRAWRPQEGTGRSH